MAAEALRLAVGTLTVVPSGPLPEIDRQTAGRAMLLAPLAVGPLAATGALLGWLAHLAGLPALVVGAAVVGAVALGTRAMHLDGLADTVDGLGAGLASRERALEVMRRGDVGPMGVAALVLVLLAQAGLVGSVLDGWRGAMLVGLALCGARTALVSVCAQGVPAARASGLGVVVAGSVARGAAALSWAGLGAVLTVAGLLLGRPWWPGPVAVVLAGVAVRVLVRHCVRRLGGVTGDVMGAGVEVALTALLVGMALS